MIRKVIFFFLSLFLGVVYAQRPFISAFQYSTNSHLLSDTRIDGSISSVLRMRPSVIAPPELYHIRIKLNNPTYANYTHADNPYNKSIVSIFQIDDSSRDVHDLMYPYLKGGITAGGYSSAGVKSTDGCGNDLFWTISAACFVENQQGLNLLEQGTTYISWSQLATVTANGPGLQRGFDYDNHGYGGSAIMQADRYKQIYLDNKAAYDHLGFHPESLVIPDTQLGFRFGSHELGMNVTSEGGLDPLKDGVTPMDVDEFSDEIYAAVQTPYFFRRIHWQENNDPYLATAMKADFLASYTKSQIKPNIFNWFSHGPGEIGTNNFEYYRQVIDYMQSLAGDNVIGLSLSQYLGYQKTRYAAEHGAGKESHLTTDGYLDITFDMSGLQQIVRNRLLSLLVHSDGQIQSIEWSSNIKAVTFNATSGLVNIQLEETESVDPATLPVRATIVGLPKVPADAPNTVVFEVDRPITQSMAAAYEVTGNPVLAVSEVPGTGGTKWKLDCENNFRATDIVKFTYRAEQGNAADIENGKRMLTYFELPIENQSSITEQEQAPLAISIRRDLDDLQLATFNTIEEVKTYMSTFNFNTNTSIVFNNAGTYVLDSKWTLQYNNSNYTLTIKGKDGLATYPTIDCGGSTSDPIRVVMSHVRIKQLKIRSGKYTGDGWGFGDNYTAAMISQQANTSDCQYTDLILHQGIGGISVGAVNSTDQPNISNILIERVTFTELTGVAVLVGRMSMSTEPEARTDASYTLNNVTIKNLTIKDTRDQATIENSGEKYYGQIQARGVNNLLIQSVESDQNQKQPIFIAYSKNILIEGVKATHVSLNTGNGYKAAFHIESSEVITIQNCFVQDPNSSLYIEGSNRIKLYHNTFDTEQSQREAVALIQVRLIEDIQGNLIAAKGDITGRPCIVATFRRTGGYIPTMATDFASEKNNLFITSSYILEMGGFDAGDVPVTVRTDFGMTLSEYRTAYGKGQNSGFAAYSALNYVDVNGVHGYLGNTSVGRAFVNSTIASISVDIANKARFIPTDAGAYDRASAVEPSVSDLNKAGIEGTPVTFAAADFSTKFNSPAGGLIEKIKFTSLPANGTLKLNSAAIAVNQEIPAADIAGITFVPFQGFIGAVTFAWNGADEFGYSRLGANVTIDVTAVPPPFPYAESFKNTAAPEFVFGGTNPAKLTAGTIDADGNGYLRLTNNLTDQFGYAYSTKAFPSGNGISATFEYSTYGGSNPYHADGISFFLFNSEALSNFQIGAGGGSLGYAQRSGGGGPTLPGLSKAFIGVGFDEFGNFATTNDGKLTGNGSDILSNQSNVTLRGDGDGNGGPENYEFLTHWRTSGEDGATDGGNFQIRGGVDGRTAGGQGLTALDIGYRQAKVDLSPSMGGFLVNVWITEGSATGGIVHHVIKDYLYHPTEAIPANLSFGFAAATGGYTNFHEIRNLSIIDPTSLLAPPVVTDITKSGTENEPVLFTASDFTGKFTSSNNILNKIKIVSLPANGVLKLNGLDVTASQEIVLADLDGFRFIPNTNFHGATSFSWNGSDGIKYALTAANVLFELASGEPSPFPYVESFKNSTAPGMVFGGSDPAILTGGATDPQGAGYLRLTSNANYQFGYAYNTAAFSSGDGLSVSFDYYTHSGGTPYNADGISFFLFDAAAAGSFQVGAFGGALGYSQRSGGGGPELPGLSKGYLGVGFDEFGNFSTTNDGKITGNGSDILSNQNSVTLRGDGDGFSSDPFNYEFLTHWRTSGEDGLTDGGNFQIRGNIDGRTAGDQGLTGLDNGYRRAKIELNPITGGFLVNVWITEGTSSGPILHHVINNYEYHSTNPRPESLSYGFAASTGGFTNVHEIRNLEISVPVIPTVSDISRSGTQNTVLTFAAADFANKFNSPNNASLSRVKIMTLPSNGTLKLNGSAVLAAQEIDVAILNAITFVPATGFSGTSTFQWNGSDGVQYAAVGANVTIQIASSTGTLFPYSETFRNSTAPGLVIGTFPSSAPAALTAGSTDANGAGYLRLTNNTNFQLGYVYNTTAFPSENGLSIGFDYYTHSGASPYNADGISFFLFDASASSAFQIGAAGGSLGYAQNTSTAGLSKAFLGIAFDEFGNFATATEGRQGGNGSDLLANQSTVTLRGDGDGPALASDNYEYLTHWRTTGENGATDGGNFQVRGNINGRTAGSNGLTASAEGYRRAKVELVPAAGGFLVNVWVTEGSASGGIVHHLINNYLYRSSNPVPENLSYGFAAATGGYTNIHEIRNLNISVPVTPVLSDVEKSGTENIAVTFTAADFKEKFNSPGGLPLAKVKITSLPAGGALKLGNVNIVLDQEMDSISLNALTFIPANNFSGTTSFGWNGSDGTQYALNNATVQLIISAVSASVFPYSESFRNSTAAGLVFGTFPGSSPATLTAGNTDAIGAGYLRLTNNTNFQLGYVYNTKAFPSANGLSVSFDYYTHSGANPYNADGISFFLFDAAASSSFQIGAAGGSLGYAQNSAAAGLSKGFLGIGFDEFGNFATASEGRQGGNGTDLLANQSTVTLRGDGDGPALAPDNYEYLTRWRTTGEDGATDAGNFQVRGGIDGRIAGAGGLTAADIGYRHARVELNPVPLGFLVNVWVTEGASPGGVEHHVIDNYVYHPTGTIPENLSYGFAAATGGFTNVHEIRNLRIDAPVIPLVSNVSKTGEYNTPITFSASDFSSKFSVPGNAQLAKIKVSNFSGSGILKLSGTPVAANQEILSEDLGALTFVPASGFSGTTSFTWNGSDGEQYASRDAMVNITISPAVASLFPYKESFKNATAAGIVFGNDQGAGLGHENTRNAYLTAHPDSTMDAAGAGYLRLTEAGTNQFGYMYNPMELSISKGLTVSFEYNTWHPNPQPIYYGYADGFSFFLFDSEVLSRSLGASQSLGYTKAGFNIGGYGGSLGYAQRSNPVPGLSKGFLGIGIDEFGNFAVATEGRQGGAPGFTLENQSSVTLRGDGDGVALTPSNYEFLTHKRTDGDAGGNIPGSGDVQVDGGTFELIGNVDGRTVGPEGLTPLMTGYRKAKIGLVPLDAANNPTETNPVAIKVNIWITEGRPIVSGGPIVHHVIQDYIYTPSGGIPASLSYGFASATGAFTDVHEIRNLEIDIPAEAPALAAIQKTAVGGIALPFSLADFTTNFSNSNNLALSKIKIAALPSHGVLKVNGSDISASQEILSDQIQNITYLSSEGYSGNDLFQWNGADLNGTYAASPANVTINIHPQLTALQVAVNENEAYTGAVGPLDGTKYSLSGPDALRVTLDNETGAVNMIGRNFENPADANKDNLYEFTVTATDIYNNSYLVNWTLSVMNVVETANFSISHFADLTIDENTPYISSLPVITGNPVGGTYPKNFTIVPIPDTQYYTAQVNGGSNTTFKMQSSWIVSNREALNISYLVHLGDCVNDGDNGGNPIQWLRADTAVSIIEDPQATQLPFGIPYGINVGNHDQSPMGDANGSTSLFNQYFGAARFAGRDYYGGHYGSNNDNNFQLFSAGGIDFIAVNLEFDPLANPSVLDWADNLLKSYPLRKAIISSHYIIEPDGNFGPQGQAIYDKLKVNANLFLMLCGHRNPNGEARRVDTFNGNTVHTLLSDFQDRPNGGNGWMRYMEFMPSENKIFVRTYSPTLNQYEQDANSQFVLDYPMAGGANAGSVTYSLTGADASRFTVDPATGVVAMLARDFEIPVDANSDNTYELTLIATDADGNTATKSWKITVADVLENLTQFTQSGSGSTSAIANENLRRQLFMTADRNARNENQISPNAAVKPDATNILSPNGDGKNDVWIVNGLDNYSENKLLIFDKAGRIIYETKNYRNDWDGTSHGVPLAQGTYYYILELDKRSTLKGFISIVR